MRNFKLLNCSGHRFAIIVLIGCASLAQLMVTPASCQRQQATAGGTKTGQQQQQSRNNILPMAFNTIDQQAPSMAPFFSIARDGKTSARRIQQAGGGGGGNGSGAGLANGAPTTQQSPSTTTTIQPSNVESTTTNSWRQSTLSNQLPQTTTTTTASSSPLAIATEGNASASSATEGPAATTSSSLDSRLYSNAAALGGQTESSLSQTSTGATSASADSESGNDQSSPASGSGSGTSSGQNEMNFVQQKMSSFNEDEFNKSMPSNDNQQPEQRQQQSDSQTGSSSTGSSGSTGNDATTTAATLSTTNGQTFDGQTPRLVMQPLNQQLDNQQSTSTGGSSSSSSSSSPSTISTPSSLSMSLDGMILNSRPRAPINSASADSNSVNTSVTGSRKNNGKSKASPVSRIGESAPSSMENSIPSQPRNNLDTPSGGAKSRRVPFTGTQFSSPATKGVRTKPKANNNQMGNMINFYSQQQPQDTLAGVEFDSMGNQRSVSMGANQMNQLFKQQPDQTNSMNQGFSRTNNQMDGFGEDTQQMRLNLPQLNGMNNQQQPSQPDSSELELMRNLLASNGASELRTQSVASNPNDMVMSVMSSADGKERRLVMIARDTLDSLQRFASQTGTSPAARGSQVVGGTKSNSNRPQISQTQQTSVSRNGRPSSGDSSSQTPSFSWTKNTNPTTNSFQQQQQQQPQATRQSGGSGLTQQQQQQQQQLEQQMQQEVQLQTTTSAPTSTSSSGFIGLSPVTTTTTTTTTTQQPIIMSTTTTQQPIESFSQDSQQGSQTGGNSQFLPESNNSTTDSKSGVSGDSFREVPVATITENTNINTNTNSDSLQPRRQPLNGSGKQQVTNTNGGVKTSGNKANKQQSAGAENGQRSSARQQTGTSAGSQSQKNGTNGGVSPSTNGKKKNTTQSSTSTSNTGSQSAKQQQQQQPSSPSKQAQKSNKTGTKSSSSNGNRKSNSSSSGGQTQTSSKKQQPSTSVRITNGQQPVGAMLGRVFEQQQEKQQQSTGSSSPVPPPVTRNGNKRVNTTTLDDEMGATVSSIIMSSGQATSSSSNEQVGVSGQQQQQQPKKPRQMQTTTTTNSSGSNKRPSQQSASAGGSTSSTSSGQPATTSGSRLSLPATMTTSSQTDRNQLDRELDEIERDQQQQQPGSSGGNNQALVMGDNININNQPNGATTDLRSAIPGEPQLDYPIYSSPPKTSFDCMSQSCPGGYYADIETQCQVFHICQSDGRFDTFLCPNGTIFSQQHFVCVWWWQVDCQQSAAFYKLNDGIYCNSMFPPSMSAQQTPTTLPNGQQQQHQFNSLSPVLSTYGGSL